MSLKLSLITRLLIVSSRAALPLVLFSGASAQTDERAVLVAERMPTRMAAADSEPLFSPLSPNATGVVFQNDIDISHPLKRLYQSGFACGGVAIGDLDGDALPELFLASGPGSNRLYRQTAPLQFDDITDGAGLGVATIGRLVSFLPMSIMMAT